MGSLGKALKYGNIQYQKGAGGLKDKTLIIDIDGSLKTSGEYEQISADPNSHHLGKLPYFLRIQKLGDYLLFSKRLYPGNLQDLTQFSIQRRIRRNSDRRSSPPFGNSRIGNGRPIFLEFSIWNIHPRRNIRPKRNEHRLTDPRLMVEMLPNAVALSQSGSASSGEPLITEINATKSRLGNPRNRNKMPKWEHISSRGSTSEIVP